MSTARNLLEILPNGHQVFDRPTMGATAEDILANTGQGAGDAAVGLLYSRATTPLASYFLRVTWCDIPPHKYEIRMNGAAQLQSYGRIRYTVYVDNVAQAT